MKKLTLSLVIAFSSSLSSAALLSAPKDIRNSQSQLEVLPPMGFLGCEECQNPYMGGVKGKSAADLELWNKWDKEIFGGSAGSNSSAGSTDDD